MNQSSFADDRAYLDITTPSVQVEVQVLDFAVFAKLVVYGLLVGFFVDVSDDYDPAFDGADGGGAGMSLHGRGLAGPGRRGRDLGFLLVMRYVDVHFHVGHGG